MEKVTPTVGVLIISNNKVLLVRHTKYAEHLTNTYGLPAGQIKPNETEVDTAIRKLKEETGLTTSKKHLIPLATIYKAKIKRKNEERIFSLKVFLCQKYSGTITGSKSEIPEWVFLTNLDNINLLPNVKEAISEGVEKIEVPDKIH